MQNSATGQTNHTFRRVLRSGVEAALASEGKRVEIFMPIEGVGMLGPLEPVDHQIGDGSGDDLVTNLEGVAGCDDVKKSANRIDSTEGKEDDENRVYGLADDSGTDGAGPELASVGEKL